MRVVLFGPGDQRWQLDTPDPSIIGLWLKGIVDSFATGLKPHPAYPLDFRITIN